MVATAGTTVGSCLSMYAGNIVTPFLSVASSSEPAVYIAVLLGLPFIALATSAVASRAITRISPVSILKSA